MRMTGLLGLLCVCAAVSADELPVYDLSKLPDADCPGWNAPAVEDGQGFRIAPKGGLRMVQLAAWWPAERLRPPEDAVYVLTIRYKDTPTAPIVCKSYGYLARYGAPDEVHRFGGSGDGAWKTARVPIGWDQLIRLPERRAFTAVGLLANADLPVASIAVAPATADDEARHNAETRAWVAHVQAEKAKTAPLNVKPLPAQGTDTFFQTAKKGVSPPATVIAFPASPLVPLPPDAQPKAEQIGKGIDIRVCLNEIEGGAFGVFANGRELTNVEYTVGPLIDEAGRKLAATITARTAEVCLRNVGKGVGWFPQRLWPAFKTRVPVNQNRWFVFNIRTERGKSAAGTYQGKVAITCDQGQAELPVTVVVEPVDLLTMDEAGLLMGGCTTGLVPAHDVAFQTAYNQNMTNLWFAGVRPEMKLDPSGKLVLDFEYLDEWMAAAAKRGLKANVWFLGGNPYGFPRTMSIFRELAGIDNRGGRKPLGQKEFFEAQSGPSARNEPLPHVQDLFKDWVAQVGEHSRKAGWPEVILTPFDEPAKWVQSSSDGDPLAIGTGPWIKTYFQKSCALIRQADPKIKIYGSIHHIDRTGRGDGLVFIDDVDCFCTNAIHEDAKIGDKVRAAGHTFWQYTGINDDPLAARYSFGFYFAAFDSRGSLCWAYNWGPGFDTTAGGDSWMYAWQTPFDTIPAPYFEGMREAWDDRRVIETYKKAFAADADAMAVLKQILAQAADSRAAGGRDTVNDFWAAVDDAAKLDKWRSTLVSRLATKGERK